MVDMGRRGSEYAGYASLIEITAVRSNAMPPGNITEMTLDERQLLARWVAAEAAHK